MACITASRTICRICRILFAEILSIIATFLPLWWDLFYSQTERAKSLLSCLSCSLSNAVSGTLFKYHFYKVVFWMPIQTTKCTIEERQISYKEKLRGETSEMHFQLYCQYKSLCLCLLRWKTWHDININRYHKKTFLRS